MATKKIKMQEAVAPAKSLSTPATEESVAASADAQLHTASTESETEALVADENAAAPTRKRELQLVVCAYPGTESIMAQIWTKMLPRDAEFRLLSVQPDMDIRTILEQCIADAEIGEDFVLVPANTFPCSPIGLEEMLIPLVYLDNKRVEHYDHRLPMRFRKLALVEILAQSDNTGEALMKEYVSTYCHRPVQVSFVFGNFVTPVLRANPCEHIVIEGFLRRKFIAANPEGFSAIVDLIQKHLL